MTIRDRVIALRQKQCARLADLPDTTFWQRNIRQEVADFISELDVILDDGKEEIKSAQ
jgi:hypothetical protein